VDKQLEIECMVPKPKPKKPKMSYIQQVMTGAIFTSAPRTDNKTTKKAKQKELKNDTPADRKIAREIQSASELMPMNMGTDERKEAEEIAKHKASKMKSWLKFHQDDPEKCETYPLFDKIFHGGESMKEFGIAISLYFSLIRWFQLILLLLILFSGYLTYQTLEAYHNDLMMSSTQSFYIGLSSLAFKDSSGGIPEAYNWTLCLHVVASVVGICAIRVFMKHNVAEIDDGIISSADFTVEVTNLPRKALTGDPDQHAIDNPTTRSRARSKGKRDKKKKHIKKGSKKEKEKQGPQELTAQDIADHFSQFGKVIHVALAFNVKKFWDLMDERDKIRGSIEELHQRREIVKVSSGSSSGKQQKVKAIEKKLEWTYKNLSITNKKIRRMDLGPEFKPADGDSDPLPTGCCTFDKVTHHKFTTTGHAYVMFQYTKDAEFCLKQLNKRPRHIYGISYSTAGNNLKSFMRDSQLKASPWVQKINVMRPVEPRDVLWKNLEYSRRDIRFRSFSIWAALIPLMFIGFAITCTISMIKLDLYRQCNASDETIDTSKAIFPAIDEFIKAYIFSGSAPSWFCQDGYIYLMTFASAIVITITNVLLAKSVQLLTMRLERSHCKSKILGKVVFRMALAQYLNSCVSLLITFNNYSTWEERGDLIDSAVSFMFVSAFQPVVAIFMKTFLYPIIQSIKRRKVVTTRALTDSYLPPPFELERKYAHLICTFMNAQFFVSLVPGVVVIATFGLTVAFWCDKLQLLRLCNSKALFHLTEAGAMQSINLAGLMTVITSVAGFLITGTMSAVQSGENFTTALEKHALKGYSLIIWVVVLLYVTLPLYWKPLINYMVKNTRKLKENVLFAQEDAKVKYSGRKFLCCGKKKEPVEEGDKEEEDEGDNVDRISPGRRRRKSNIFFGNGKSLRSLKSGQFAKSKQREIGDTSGDFFKDDRIANIVKHFQAPTPTCMMPYQKIQNAVLHNHAVDAIVILDGNSNGELHADDFKEALENLGIYLKPHEAEAVVQLYDTDGDGFVSTEEFMDAASTYKDADGHVDFFAFASGIVKELEEEFGPIDNSGDTSSSSEDSEYSDVESITDECGNHTPAHCRRSTSHRRGMSIPTPPVSTDDVEKVEELISRRMKVQHYEKTGEPLTWEDYEGTGITRPKHIVHSFAGMSKRDRAHYAYKHTPTKRGEGEGDQGAKRRAYSVKIDIEDHMLWYLYSR